jgi:uncharacterized protein YvpB
MRKSIIFIISIFLLATAVFLFMAGDKIFGIISPPKITNINPPSLAQNVALDSKITVNFDKPVSRKEISFTISPEVLGAWEFKNPMIKNHLFKTSVFSPAIGFLPETDYQVQVENIKSVANQENDSFSLTFSTEKEESAEAKESSEKPTKDNSATSSQPQVTLVKTVFNWQKYNLSCEAASLKMALSAKEIYVSEDEIMRKIGYDTTPHQGDIWGDPESAFVGDINGKICNTGYGVHWGPVAEAANNWTQAEAFSGWTLEQLINELKSGNPVIMWGTLPVGNLHNYSWHTPQGKYIQTYRETHVRLIVGFIGEPENPTKIILNDPLSGKLYWDTAYFLKNWQAFNFSGVVVR